MTERTLNEFWLRYDSDGHMHAMYSNTLVPEDGGPPNIGQAKLDRIIAILIEPDEIAVNDQNSGQSATSTTARKSGGE